MNLTKSLLKVKTNILKCPIGFYEEERIIGNDFQVKVEAECKIDLSVNDDTLENSVNYEEISKIIEFEMKQETLFIETVCRKIFIKVKKLSTDHKWSVSIKKLTVPLNNIKKTEFKLSDD